MVVVVPALSATEHREDETVLTAIAGVVANPADDVRQGVDEEGAMIEDGSGNEEAPDQSREAPHRIHQPRVEEGRNDVKLVEEP